jgi:hypothetical protein
VAREDALAETDGNHSYSIGQQHGIDTDEMRNVLLGSHTTHSGRFCDNATRSRQAVPRRKQLPGPYLSDVPFADMFIRIYRGRRTYAHKTPRRLRALETI